MAELASIFESLADEAPALATPSFVLELQGRARGCSPFEALRHRVRRPRRSGPITTGSFAKSDQLLQNEASRAMGPGVRWDDVDRVDDQTTDQCRSIQRRPRPSCPGRGCGFAKLVLRPGFEIASLMTLMQLA